MAAGLERKKILIIGAGPAGSAAAIFLARKGFGVHLLDKCSFPRAKTCGGGLSARALSLLCELGLETQIRDEAYPIDRIRLVSPRKESLVLKYDTPQHFILPRSRFDQILVRQAEAEGVLFSPNRYVTRLLRDRGGRIRGAATSSEEILADLVILAGGAASGLVPSNPKRNVLAGLVRFSHPPPEPNTMIFYWAPQLRPHYAWVFPESDSQINVGCGAFHPLNAATLTPLLETVFHEGAFFPSPLHLSPQEVKIFPIPFWDPHRNLIEDGLISIGDSAGVANVASGEGIFQAMLSARIVSEVVAELGSFDQSSLSLYARKIQSHFRKQRWLSQIFLKTAWTPLFYPFFRALRKPSLKKWFRPISPF